MDVKKAVHPVCALMRELRIAAGLSLLEAGQKMGLNAIVLGSYERGDRNPPLPRAEYILNAYGYTLAPKPMRVNAVRSPVDMASTLRAIADQLAGERVVSVAAEHQGGAAAIW